MKSSSQKCVINTVLVRYLHHDGNSACAWTCASVLYPSFHSNLTSCSTEIKHLVFLLKYLCLSTFRTKMNNVILKGMNTHYCQQGSYGFVNRVPLLFQRRTSYCGNLFKCSRARIHRIYSSAHLSQDEKYSDLEKEMEQAKKEARPYRIDKSKLSDKERQKLRLHSKSIPLVADDEPLDVLYEDENFLVVNKPAFLKMHPSHRFQGGSLLNRAIGHCGFAPYLVHRLDMVRLMNLRLLFNELHK